jgi:DNA helicase II / ATP-dependent DNA helicase PcrA
LSASPTLQAAAPFEHLLEGLTPDQTIAVTHGSGPQVIFAGPGAGKTRTLTARVRYLLATGRAIPREIVLVTFTNNAARECQERLEKELGRDAIAGMVICTFHALCARLLRAHAPLINRTASFTIYDERALRGVLEEILKDETRIPVLAALEGRAPCPIEEITGEISLAKNRLWTPEFYARHSRHKHAPLIAAAWAELDKELENSNAASFDDLLCLAVRLLGEHPDLQAHYRSRWRWLLVDEVQDTCYAQMGLLRLLAQPAGNLSICGDADQALYAFRGAEPRNLLSFRALFPSRRTVTLAVNFRSYEEIVRRAEAVIANNSNRETIEFVAARGAGGHVIAKACDNEHAEAGWIAKEIARQISNGVRPQQILVLARSAFAYAPVRKALERSGIPHHVLGSLGLFERGEVKTALAYLQLIQNPLDAIALRRAIQHPRREVGEKSCQAIVAHARREHIDLLEACARQAQIPGLRKRGRANLERFAKQMLAIRDAHEHGAPVSHTVNSVLAMGGGLERYFQWVREHPQKPQAREEADAALVLLAGMRDAARRFEQQTGAEATLLGFVERAVGLHSDGPAIVNDGVGVSTIHGAKGMEAPVVFLCGCEEEITPSRHAIATRRLSAIEDERCAFYVGMTRAEDLLVMTWSGVRQGRATLGRSRFINEAGF